MGKSSHFDVLIMGGGVNGLMTAYHLTKNRKLKIGIAEQFSLGHAQGSSHGMSRIFRSTYTNPIYIQLAQRARNEGWPSLEKELHCQLIYPCSRLVFGEGKAYETWLSAILKHESELEIELLEAADARQKFPQFRFASKQPVLRDFSSGVIASHEVMENLTKFFIQRNVNILEETCVTRIIPNSSFLQVETVQGSLTCERLVITAGPWIRRFIAEKEKLFRPIRQTVGYFKLRGSENLYQIPSFPNWAYFGEGENNTFYGLPEFRCEGIKVAQDVTEGEAEDPNKRETPSPSKLKVLEDFVSKHFAEPVDRLVHSETCFYTNTSAGDFVLDFLPEDGRIIIGSACSGHAFKFAPLIGRILSELAIEGKTTVPEFEEYKKLFSIS